MNWIKKVLNIGEKIKKVIRERPSKEDVEKSNWTTCCAGPIFKKQNYKKISGFANHVENIIELVVKTDLIYFLVKIIMKL
jgi:acetyl-CoA carboxylase carboxyltransferase subunit alpha